MDPDEVRTRLNKRRLELEAVSDSAAEAAATVTLDQSRVGRLSRMDALAQQAVAQATSARRRRELTDIKHALRRLDDGAYGLCSACDEPIAEARLQASPAVRLCLSCAERSESG